MYLYMKNIDLKLRFLFLLFWSCCLFNIRMKDFKLGSVKVRNCDKRYQIHTIIFFYLSFITVIIYLLI